MNLLVISDLHICNGDNFSTFNWDTTEFIEVLENIKRIYSIDKVILNGDIYELYKYKFEEIEQRHPELIKYLKSNDFIYIRGNHDCVNSFGLESYLIENSSGKKIYIEHGHNADFFNGTRFGRLFGRILFKLLKSLTLSNHLRNYYFKAVERMEEMYSIPHYNAYKYLKYALKLMNKFDVVILGHTHKLEMHKIYHLNNKKRYLNTGSCTLGRFQGVLLNTETLRYETIKINRNEIQQWKDQNFRLTHTA